MKFYQACFGKPNNINWSLFHVSEDLPAHLGSFYEKAENSNTPQNLDKRDMIDANGNPLCMYEIVVQGKAVAVSKIQYGTTDNMGRPKMSAHGFLFDDSSDVLRDPNHILTIADSNFSFNMDCTKDVPGELVREQAYNLWDAMNACHLNQGNVVKLMACIYFSLTSATDFPIYIISDRKDEVIKPLMYCVYSLLPFSLRYNLSVSNANNFVRAQFKSVMVVDREYSGGYCLNLNTMETNIPLNEVFDNIGKYPFLQKLQTMGVDGFADYCMSLERELERMQLKDAREYNIVKLADTFMQGVDCVRNLNDNELIRHLLEVSSYAPMQNGYIDSYITKVARMFMERNMIPNDAVLGRLRVRSEKTSSEELVDIYKQLQMKVLMEAGVEKVVEFLGEQRVSSWERFYEWCRYILEINSGHLFVGEFYAQKLISARTLDEIQNLYEEGVQLVSFETLSATANDQCYKIARRQLLDGQFRDYSGLLEHYSDVYKSINGRISDNRCKESVESLKNDYWNQFELCEFQFIEEDIDKYQCLVLDVGKNTKCDDVRILMELYSFLNSSKIETWPAKEVMGEVVAIMNEIEDGYHMSRQEFLTIVPKILKLIAKKLIRYGGSNFYFWYTVAQFGKQETGVNPFQRLLDWNLDVFADEERFKTYVIEKEKYHNLIPDFTSLLGSLLLKYDNKSEEYKLIKRRHVLLSDKQNEIEKLRKKEEKMKIKEEKKKIKEEKRRK